MLANGRGTTSAVRQEFARERVGVGQQHRDEFELRVELRSDALAHHHRFQQEREVAWQLAAGATRPTRRATKTRGRPK